MTSAAQSRATKSSAPANPSAGWRRSISTAGALGFVLAACSGPTDPPAPPSGGSELVLDYATFLSSVSAILSERGCDAGGDCHGGGIRGTFELSPLEAKDPSFDFEQASLQVLPVDRAQSPLLTKPLAVEAGGAPHSSEPFSSREDPGFVAIESWINEGERR